jgi:hypothetical protein
MFLSIEFVKQALMPDTCEKGVSHTPYQQIFLAKNNLLPNNSNITNKLLFVGMQLLYLKHKEYFDVLSGGPLASNSRQRAFPLNSPDIFQVVASIATNESLLIGTISTRLH